jgi:hypothetical protein
MKNKSIFILIIIFSVIVLVVLLMTIPKKFPNKTPSALLSSNLDFPSEWTNDKDEVTHIDWIEYLEKGNDSTISLNNNGITASRLWTNQGLFPNPSIRETIIRYRNPLIAEFYFLLNRPEIYYRNKWPNFSPFCNDYSYCYSKDWDKNNLINSQEIVVCAMGYPDNCQMWYFWTKYGQYLISIEVFVPSQGMRTNYFQHITEIFIRDFQNKLNQIK